MKKVLHKAEERGTSKIDWLDSKHSFSFSDYYDPKKMNFGLLRVLNDDIIKAGHGFGTHPHNNMEIISVPIYGSLKHNDSMGNEYIIKENEIQIMSAGTGVRHSEYNPSLTQDCNFLQIWILPKKINIEPRYEQKSFNIEKNKLNLIISPERNNESLWINQDAYLYLSKTEKNNKINYDLKSNKGSYIFLIEGELEVNGQTINRRDAIGIWETNNLEIISKEDSHFLLIDVPMN